MITHEEILLKALRFDWDKYNVNKNKIKHEVDYKEAQEVLVDFKAILLVDKKHSSVEERFFCLGKTRMNRMLIVIFTMRGNRIRPISARTMSKKERKIYENSKKI